jgi:plasmid stabilization system protein ParE
MSSINKVCKKKRKNPEHWMFLCNKMNTSESTNTQIREYAENSGINTKGKNRLTLCKELGKFYDKKITIESNKEYTIESNKEYTIEYIEILKKKLSNFIDNPENGYRNYFTLDDINDWLEEKSSYDYHVILYYVRKFNIVKKNRKTQKELYAFKDFPNLGEMLKLLTDSMELIPIVDIQKYALFLKKIFIEEEEKIDEDEGIGEFYQYEYENEYGVLRSF